MATPISLHPITMRLLTVVLVISFLLTTATLLFPQTARAEFYCNWQYQGRININCGVTCGAWVGWLHGCWDNLYYRRCCDAYHCWYTGETGTSRQCGCPC